MATVEIIITDPEQEIWKPVPFADFAAFYSVSNMGRLRRDARGNSRTYAGRMLRANVINGYYRALLWNDAKQYLHVRIHRLVALTFIGPSPDGKPDVNHIDGDKTHNAASNLEWVSPQENTHHAIKVLGRHIGGRARKGLCKMTPEDVARVKHLKATTKLTNAQIAEFFPVTKSQIGRICSGQHWRDIKQLGGR